MNVPWRARKTLDGLELLVMPDLPPPDAVAI
jgi:hypothetical protein